MMPQYTDHGEGAYRRIGDRLISAGCLTEEQRDAVLQMQQDLEGSGKHMRFGALAVQMGFCTIEQVENLPGYIGEKLVMAGLITPEQCRLIVTWQTKLREKGKNIRFGDLAANEGLCSASQIETIVKLHKKTAKETIH